MMKLRLQKSKNLSNILSLIVLFTMTLPFQMKATTKTWIAGTGNWTVASNWSPAGVPKAGDIAIIPAKNAAQVKCVVTVAKGLVYNVEQLVLNGGSLTMNSGSRLNINGTTQDGFVVTEGSVFLNKGTLKIDNVGLNGISTLGTMGRSTFTNEGAIRIGELGRIGAEGIRLTRTDFTNTAGGKIFIDNTFDVDNSGTGFALVLTASSIFNNIGEITLGGTNAVARGIDSPNPIINDGTLTFGNIEKDGVSAQTTIINNSTIDVLDQVQFPLEMNGTIENLGLLSIDGKFNNNGTVNNNSFLTVYPTGNFIDKGIFMNDAAIRNYGLISIEKSKTFNMTGIAFFFNEASGIVNVEGVVNIAAGGLFDSFGTTQGDWNIIENGLITSQINSKIAPGIGLNMPVGAGNGIGMLTTNGDLDLMAGTLDIEAQGATFPNYDRLRVNGNVTITAESKLVMVHGFVNGVVNGVKYKPVTGDEITVIRSNTLLSDANKFLPANINIPSGWEVFYNQPQAGDVTLRFNQLLPVELLSFKAANKGVTNLVTWETASEITNKGFEVQRKDEQGNWTTLGFVKGNGVASVYNYTDNNPLSISYYRLNQIDHDGKSELSKVVSVIKQRKLEVSMYPNPTYGKVTVQLEKEGTGVVTVYNIVGQVMMANQVLSTVGEVDLSGLTRGTYILEVKSEGAVSRTKVVKQ
jgi:Secretion system C-terminal sorting domain